MIWASACSLSKLRSTIRLYGSSNGVSAAKVSVTGAENVTAIAAENTKARTRASTEMRLVPGRLQLILSLKMDLNPGRFLLQVKCLRARLGGSPAQSAQSHLYEKAMLWELIPLERNPMALVELKGVSKRLRPPRILTEEEFGALLNQLVHPYRCMVLLAGCTGLRVSEVMGLRWSGINFESL